MHIRHPLLREGSVEFRGYQANLARIAGARDTLVVLPTGMGKTVVALLVLADALNAGAQRVLVMAPTRPLVDQHAAFLRGVLLEPWASRVHALTGHTAPAKREAAYAEPGIVVATPQVVQNDLVARKLDPARLDWVVYDEAHRAMGDYPYTFIGGQFRPHKVRRLALTASPGHDAKKIEEVRTVLGLAHIEVRTPADPDVAPFVQEIGMEWETLPLPPSMARVSAKLQEALSERLRSLKNLGFNVSTRPNRRELLLLGADLQSKLGKAVDPDSSLFVGLSLQAQAMKLQHAIEQVETQGSAAFVQYLESMREEIRSGKPSKATKSVADDPRVNEAYHVARFDDAENPKLGRTGTLVQQLLAAQPDSRAIVFTHYRATCELVAGHLAKLPGVNPVTFVGQSKRGAQEGLTQKQQHEVLERFRAGAHNVLVATSVAEEGLDIPSTDLVVFFEPIPSEIRSIQRRGRTGRHRAGRVVVLMTKGTQDEAAHWSARRKELQMVRELQSLRAALGNAAPPPAVPAGQQRLDAPAPTPASPKEPAGPAPRVVFDAREQAGGVVKHLAELGCILEGRTLDTGDFVLSDRIVVERKSCADFVDSLVDGRLFEQLRALKAYPRPFLLLEGESLHGHRAVSPEAIFGALAAIVVEHGIPVVSARDPLETARFLHAVAKREQFRDHRKMAVRPAKPAMDDRERQLFLVAGLPGISDTLAERLLARFGSAAAVFAASAAALAEVDGVGPGKASEVRRVLDAPYAPRRLVDAAERA
ncbi:MAG: hypothetical protein QOD77_1005 [Thermoplasmata archaeon]|nr:hypothetical protein [Thermoplasmata archaeon]